MSNVSLVEIFWCLPLIPGLIASSMTIRDTFYERRAAFVRYGTDSPEEYIATWTFAFECGRWVQQLLLLAAGIFAMTEPERPHFPGYVELVALLMLFVYWLSFNSIYTRYFRRRVTRLMRKVREGG